MKSFFKAFTKEEIWMAIKFYLRHPLMTIYLLYAQIYVTKVVHDMILNDGYVRSKDVAKIIRATAVINEISGFQWISVKWMIRCTFSALDRLIEVDEAA